jgi:DNA repair protein SbcC/Rad50
VLTRIEITDYQSLRRACVPLGRFTVVTGPTGSGKSAVIRALRLLAFNARGAAYIRTGTSLCKVVAGGEDWVAGIQRSVTRGRDGYRLALGTETAQTYTKLGGGVPDDILKVLGLTELNFASQFDSPYLLTLSGTETARVLGELTNVTLVFTAAAEAGRRRKELSRDLKAAQGRVEQLAVEAARFQGLGARRAAVVRAGELAEAARDKAARAQRLRLLVTRVRTEQAGLEQARQVVADHALPALDSIEQAAARLSRLRQLAGESRQAAADVVLYGERVRAAERAEQDAHEAVHAALAAAGQCPMCGQDVR